MAQGVILTKTGIFLRRWNSERGIAHRRGRKGRTHVVVSKALGEVVFEADTAKNLEQFFYDLEPIDNILWCCGRIF